MPNSIRNRISIAWTAFVLFCAAAVGYVVDRYHRFQAWRLSRKEAARRRLASEKAEQALLGRFQNPTDTPTGGLLGWRVKRRMKRTARQMAELAPNGLTRIAQPVDPPEAPPEPYNVTVSVIETSRTEDVDWAAEETQGTWSSRKDGFAKPSENPTTSGLTRVSVIQKPFLTAKGAQAARKTGSRKPEQFTTPEVEFSDRMADATPVMIKPRRSEIQKVDTQVGGFWETNPNTAEEVQLAIRTPIVYNQIREIIHHLITSRPSIQGPPELVEPIRRWFEIEIEHQTGFERGLDRFVADLAVQMLHYGSAALVKQRTSSDALDPVKDPLRGRTVAPVWSYAIPDMSTLEVFIDDFGRARKWRQSPNLFPTDRVKTYGGRDVHVVKLPSQNSSLYFWTPSYVMPALYAITVLRELHGIMDGHTRAIIDLPHYVQVGHEAYQDGVVTASMVNKTKTTIDGAPRGTTPVVPWYVKFNAIEQNPYIGELIKAANFWETEVRRGVGGSMLQDGVGDSATRNTSDALVEKEMRVAQALVPEIQRAFRWLILDKLFELVPNFDPTKLKSWEEMPALVFEEIDMSQQIRRETHYVSLWNADGLKHGEFRKAIGRDVDTERQDLYFSDIKAELAAEQAEADNDAAMELEKQKAKIKSQTTPGGSPRPKRAKSS